MDRKSFELWLDAIGNAWKTLDPQAAANICAPDVAYHETPFDPPLRSRMEVEERWQKDLKNQEDVHFSYDIITVNRDLGVAHWDASFTRVSSGVRDELDGVFVVSLDDQGLCTEFRQWWVVKPRE